MINFTFNILKSNNIDWANIIAMVLTGLLSAGVALWIAGRNNNKQFQMFKIQLEEQQKQWKYDTLLKTKIEMVVELRKLYLKFMKETIFFCSIFLPDGLYITDRKNNSDIDYFDMNTDGIAPYFLNSNNYYDSFEIILSNNLKTANELYIFLENNEFFINRENKISTELSDFVKSFLDYYINLAISKNYFNSILVKVAENEYKRNFDKNFNEHFLKFMDKRLPYVKNNIRTHVFFMIEPSIFSVNKQCYTDENIKIWASNCKVLHSIAQSIYRWLAITKQDINNLVENYIPEEKNEA